MKKLLAGIFAATAVFASPVLAQPEVKPYSLDAMGCMRLFECTEDVEEVSSLADIVDYYGDDRADFDSIYAEANSILKGLNDVGATIYIADARYFPTDTRGLYYPDDNVLFLNAGRVVKPHVMINILRHEGWHAVQDCMAGTIDNTFLAVVFTDDNVPPYWKEATRRLYPASVVPWEQEAKWIASEQGMVGPALQACQAGNMWETYTPTPMTGEWLQQNGYIK
jgi:hypothetical protein